MKNFKRLTAITMAATMLLGSSLMVSAAGPEGGDTGSGSYEGYVEETSVFSASIPTEAANVFNFFVDPNGLLERTGYARLEGKGAAAFETGSTLYFTRTPSDTVKEFGKDSEKVTAKNMSSYDVNIEVSATITGIDGITMADSADIDPSDPDTPKDPKPILYLAIVHGSEEEVVKAGVGGSLTGVIAGTPSNFDIQYNKEKSKYEYVVNTGVADTSWATYDFYLTGACGGTWTDAQAEATPEVALTWKITDPNAQEAPSIAKNTYEYVAGQALAIPVSLGAGDLAATGIVSVTTNGNPLPTTRYSLSNGKLIFTGDYAAALNGLTRTHTVTFNDVAKTKFDITLTPWVANLAPSIEKTSYEYVGGQNVEIPIDLGRGNLAATGVTSITFNGGSVLPADKYSFSNGKLIFNSVYTTALSGTTRTHTVTLNDAAKTTFEVTLQGTK